MGESTSLDMLLKMLRVRGVRCLGRREGEGWHQHYRDGLVLVDFDLCKTHRHVVSRKCDHTVDARHS
jgi:hypothetical protein